MKAWQAAEESEVDVVGRRFSRFPSAEVCGHVDGTTNDATRMIQPHAARACCAVVAGPNKKKANLARPAEGPRPLVTFPILLGTPLSGQSRRPRGTPCAACPPPPLQPLPASAHFSVFPPRKRAAPLLRRFFSFFFFFFFSKSVIGHRYSSDDLTARGIAAFLSSDSSEVLRGLLFYCYSRCRFICTYVE